MGASLHTHAQADKLKRPSPPTQVRTLIDSAEVAIFYSSPAVKGRLLWGGLVPYGKIWRTGANEATIFESSKDITIQGEKLQAGKYALFTIPGEDDWTLVLNSDWDQWGAFKYDKAKDVLRVKIPVTKSPSFNERLKFEIVEDIVNLYWENIKASFKLN